MDEKDFEVPVFVVEREDGGEIQGYETFYVQQKDTAFLLDVLKREWDEEDSDEWTTISIRRTAIRASDVAEMVDGWSVDWERKRIVSD